MIYTGTSGYYFKDWTGSVYPEGTKPADMLNAYWSLSFNSLELNFTYYRMPSSAQLSKFSEAAPSGVSYIIKAYKGITHDFEGKETASIFADNYREGCTKGNFRGVLLQFPESFRMSSGNFKYIDDVSLPFSGIDVYVEFRSSEWYGRSAYAFLKERSLGIVSPDLPQIGKLPKMTSETTAKNAYFRLHGRNMDWYRAADRYDYLYSGKEMEEIQRFVREAASSAKDVFVFFNNCHGGFAAKNALDFMEMERR